MCDKIYSIVFVADSGVARLEWARVQRFQKGHLVPLTGFVCSANKQSPGPYSGSFWVGLIGLKFVIQAKVKDFRKFQTKPTTAGLYYALFKKIYFLINRMIKI